MKEYKLDYCADTSESYKKPGPCVFCNHLTGPLIGDCAIGYFSVPKRPTTSNTGSETETNHQHMPAYLFSVRR